MGSISAARDSEADLLDQKDSIRQAVKYRACINMPGRRAYLLGLPGIFLLYLLSIYFPGTEIEAVV